MRAWLLKRHLQQYSVYDTLNSEFEGIFEYGSFSEAHVLAEAIVELFECFLLIVREALFEILVMSCHIVEEFLHLIGICSAVLLRNDVTVPQFVNNAFRRLYLLLAHNNTTEGGESPDLFRNNFNFFSAPFL